MEEALILSIPESKAVSKPISREQILEFENKLLGMASAIKGDFKNGIEGCPLQHSFCDGMYVREIFIPAGVEMTGAIHKHDHPNFLLKGEVVVATEEGLKYLKAPLSMISLKGTKRALRTITDTVWVTVHLNKTNTHDFGDLEKDIVADNYKELDQWLEERKLIGETKEMTNCGLLALSNITDFKNISVNTIISLAADNGVSLTAYKVPVDKIYSVPLPAIFHSNDHFTYVSDAKQLEGMEFTGTVLSAHKLIFAKTDEAEYKKVVGGTVAIVGVVVGAGGTAAQIIKGKEDAKRAADQAEKDRLLAEKQIAAQLELQRLKNEGLSLSAAGSGKTLLYVSIGGGVLLLGGILFWVFSGNNKK